MGCLSDACKKAVRFGQRRLNCSLGYQIFSWLFRKSTFRVRLYLESLIGFEFERNVFFLLGFHLHTVEFMEYLSSACFLQIFGSWIAFAELHYENMLVSLEIRQHYGNEMVTTERLNLL